MPVTKICVLPNPQKENPVLAKNMPHVAGALGATAHLRSRLERTFHAFSELRGQVEHFRSEESGRTYSMNTEMLEDLDQMVRAINACGMAMAGAVSLNINLAPF